MKQEQINLLIEKFLAGKATNSERTALMDWYRAVSQTEVEILLNDPSEKDALRQKILGELKDRIAKTKLPVKRLPTAKSKWVTRVAVAASIILILGAGYWLFQKSVRKSQDQPLLTVHDIAAPNVAKATLKLFDGRVVYLDGAGFGSLAKQGNVNVLKLSDGKIIYQPSGTARQPVIQYNTITNPRGSKVISLTLADGTEIWLNSASSITYPTAFAGTERRVEISGEAYFKVVHNSRMPFKVAVNNLEVTDLGTEFNIRAYHDEQEIQTTLVEGSVKLSREKSNPLASSTRQETAFLKPHQQATVSGDAPFDVHQLDVLDEVTAWKEGLFHFESARLPVILKEFSHWYDIDVEYSGKIPIDRFFLIFKRSSSLATVLEALRATGIKFQIEGRKLMVEAE